MREHICYLYSDKGLISKLYEELYNLTTGRQTIQLKIDKRLN